ncbi:MAG TPA: hypothetical protein VF042_15080 [Gemmatimonadaceae bacterium]
MRTSTSVIKALVVIAALIPPGKAMAQRNDGDWLEDCRRDGGDRYGRREVFCDIQTTGSRSPSREISMEGLRNGAIEVTGWDRDSMAIRARIRVTARSQSEARSIASQVKVTIRGGDVIVEGPRQYDEAQWNASLIAMVPNRSNLRAETRNGPVTLRDLRGDIDAITSNGPLTLSDLGGTVRARTTNGPLTITLTGSKWDGTGLEARTTNGPLTISVPDGYNAHLEAGTTNGPISLGFPITVVGRITRDISTDLGSGGASIRATTTNGPLTIRRR